MMKSTIRRKPMRKTLKFDEVSLIQHSVRKKDYGLMGVTEAKTPFPRKSDPISASLLRQRLLAVLQEQESHDSKKQPAAQESWSTESTENEAEVAAAGSKEHLKFLRKRKQFYRSEFTIAKQKLNMAIYHALGESIGDDWRIVRFEFNISDDSIDDLQISQVLLKSEISR